MFKHVSQLPQSSHRATTPQLLAHCVEGLRVDRLLIKPDDAFERMAVKRGRAELGKRIQMFRTPIAFVMNEVVLRIVLIIAGHDAIACDLGNY